jgi:hypothetical protein
MLTFGSFRRSTPTIALEVMSYVPPLDLVLEGEAVKAWLRIKDIRTADVWDGIGRDQLRSHRHDLKKLSQTYQLQLADQDAIAEVNKWERKYRFNDDIPDGTPLWSTVTCHTAGFSSNSQAGVGVCIQINGQPAQQVVLPLGGAPNQFQTDLMAIQLAAVLLRQHAQVGPIALHTTSKPALQVLDQPSFTSSTALATAAMLDELSEGCRVPVVLSWGKAGTKHTNTDQAVLLARQASAMPVPRDAPVVATSKTCLKRQFQAALEAQWDLRWQNASTTRQGRLFWPHVDRVRSQELLHLSRGEFSVFVRLFTGHNNLNRHCYHTGEVEDDTCRLCQEDEESSEHILCKCSDLMTQRQRSLGTPIFADSTLFSSMPLSGTRRFISMINRQLQEQGLDKI